MTAADVGSSLSVGDELPRSPKLTASSFVQVTQQLSSNHQGFVRFDYSYSGEQLASASGVTQLGAGNIIDNYHLGRVRAGIYTDRYGIDLWVSNLRDTRPAIDYYDNFSSPISFLGVVSSIQPRTYGVALRANF